ncbi:uncharacterized protein At5g08430-like [Prosopis cineraria]|uniref:uncharacterized protein At5g08430-like n=1 Tax=Prosopis cineraria TaxID=364024 RepID=UPI00240EFE11|nr:uncharacterized protein At5g08430-like [Prosopis cineraria]XP_054789629.1 uncharacterized protein At5g08430-like [Prosopis cineraria]XP_054789630.1 uncharacterized protein At5g08430-like [Prosopis cineraria]
MGRKKELNKEEIAEDWCFICKDGGLLILCEYKDCLKAYHTECVGKEESFSKTGNYPRCSWHNCFLCHKASKFQCFCCPNAVCGRCFCDAEFSVVKGNKGFCSHCLRLAQLVEENADVDSDGEKIDFKDQDTYEFLFSDYYKIIKGQEGWNSQQVHSAYKLLKNGKNYNCDWELCEMGDGDNDSEESEDNFVVSDDDGFNDIEVGKPGKKRKSHVREVKTTKEKAKDKKKEFIGWGSRGLVEFLHHIGRDTSKVLSQHDVCSIIIQYCKENKLFHPEKKKKIIFDAKLKSLLGRKSVNKNSIYNLLTPHFADNCEEMEDDTTSGSEDRDKNESVNCKKQRRLSSSSTSYEDLVSEGHQSCFAAIVSSNIKLVYLKRSLIEELLTQPATFDGKVIGSFVRVKSDPNDYLQKNSHQLLQVVGIKRPLKNNEINKEILLHLSNVPIDVPICKVSDDDFSEEECRDLNQRMKDGLLSQPKVVELEQKARSLHEDIIKHWILRELASLQRRIDQANEKGWRRELSEYMDRKLLLQTQSEQSRLLNDRPKVIPDILYTKPSQEPEDTPGKDKLEVTPSKDKQEQNGLPKYVPGEPCIPLGNAYRTTAAPETPEVKGQDGGTISAFIKQSPISAIVQEKCTPPRKQLQSSSKVKQVNTNSVHSEKLRLETPTCYTTSKSGVSQPRHSDSGSYFDGRKSDKLNKKQSTPVGDMIVLSDDDEQNLNAQIDKLADKNPEIPIWHCVSPCGEKRGPFSMSLLKRWSETSSTASEFKVWRTGQSERDAILLPDALRQCLPES